MADVVLVCMPFVDLPRPALGLSLLKAILNKAGVSTVLEYGSVRFADQIGLDEYLGLTTSSRFWHQILTGEWIFSELAFPEMETDWDAVLDTLLVALPRDSNAAAERQKAERALRTLRRQAKGHVREMCERILARNPRIVGCTSTFQQHVASLALLRRIRELAPQVITMLGGGNCETRMGLASHRNFHWVDYVVSGEADALIAPLCQRILQQDGQLAMHEVPYGVLAPVHREMGYPLAENARDPVPRAVFSALDELPYPDFADYFQQLKETEIASAVRVGLPVETSRGCWWGAVQHCTFCGLNGGGMGYRMKSPERAFAELDWLANAWACDSFEVVDNIMDMSYFRTLLPKLQDSERPWNIFYEVKSNLKREQVQMLAAAGVRWIQPGIESLHSNVLTTMRKGATGAMHVLLLKWAREFGVFLNWNLLCAFPTEDDAWYVEMAELIPLLCHFQPPAALTPIRIDRYSPYFQEPERYGLELQAHPMMRHVYPLSEEDLFDHSYHFSNAADDDDVINRRPGLRAVQAAVDAWQLGFPQQWPELVAEARDGTLHITDTRPCAVRRHNSLQGLKRAVFEACESGSTDRKLLKMLASEFPGACHQEQLEKILHELEEDRVLTTLDGQHISLAVSAGAARWPFVTSFPGGQIDFARIRKKPFTFDTFLEQL